VLVRCVPVSRLALKIVTRGIAVLVAVAATAWCAGVGAAEPSLRVPALGDGPVREIVERGVVESAKISAVRCEVTPPDNSPGTTITKIVPDGKVVEKDEVLVTLDSSAWDIEVLRQQAVVVEAAVAVKRAKDDLDTANLAKREYAEGTYVVQLQSIKNDIVDGEHQVRRADADLKTLQAGQGIPVRQLQDAQFAAEKAHRDLDLAKARLDVLEKLTKDKTLRQLTADVDGAASRLKGEEANQEFAQQRLAWIQSQVALCTIHAPMAGTVVYWRPNLGGEQLDVIREGRRVPASQPILSVADMTQVQVRFRVDQAQVALLKTGLKARIVLDPPTQRELAASIASVGDRPASTSTRFGLKEYDVILHFEQPSLGLRIGQPVSVRIATSGVAAAAVPTRKESQWDALFDKRDLNHDGRLDASEVPAALWEVLQDYDTNGDGFIDRAEWRKMNDSLNPPSGR
jgi:HlyD family secretion protein